MGAFNKGDVIKLKYGGEAVVLDELGAGGQGTVYKVKYNGKEVALKWYHQGSFGNQAKKFYDNLENNINKGAPNASFLWPKAITGVLNNSFGYLMDLRPTGYYELTDFFVNSRKHPQQHFKSFTAQINAAINIIQGFRELHNSGYSYQDINNGNFFINPNNGDVLICDNDNVAPYGTNLGVLGKQRYMAPEVVTGKKEPDKMSDRFSMSVVLFRLLFINHPLEGVYSTPPCLTKQLERKYYGEEPIFVYDKKDNRNRPIPGTDNNLKTFWPIYPQYLKDLFERAFSNEVLHLKEQRIIEQEWLDAFLRLKAEIVICPHCKKETFISCDIENKCIECGKKIDVLAKLELSKICLPLYPTSKVMLWNVDSTQNDVTTVLGEVIANPNDNNVIGIVNRSDRVFKIDLPDGTQKPLEKNKVVPIRDGFEIEFTNDNKNKGKIIVK